MVKRLIFTILLVIIGVFYSCMAVKPAGPFASLQDQDNIESAASVKPDEKGKAGSVNTGSGSVIGKAGMQLKSFFNKLIPKRIQLSLTEKSNQVLKAWTGQQSVHGVINVLQTADHGALSVKPGQVLAPYDNNHKVISFFFLTALWIIILGKTIVSFSVPVICLVIIPLILIFNIVALWKSKDDKNTFRIVFASVAVTLMVTVAVPVVMKISILVDDYIFAKQVNEIVISLEESGKSAGRIDADLRTGRKSNATLQAHMTFTRRLSNTVIKDSFAYLLIFTVIFILIPIFSGIGLYKLTRLVNRKIMKR